MTSTEFATLAIEVHKVQRLTNTVNGNPRWKITYTDPGSTTKAKLTTKPDTMDAAKLREFAGPGTLKVDATIDKRGYVIGWTEHGRLCHCPECY